MVGLRCRRVFEVAGARHAAQPLLDVAPLQSRCSHHVVDGHRALALHGAEQSGARADVRHAGRHRARHVAEHLVDGELGLFFVHLDSGPLIIHAND